MSRNGLKLVQKSNRNIWHPHLFESIHLWTPLPLIHFLFTAQFIWYCQISQGQNSKTNPNFPKHLQSTVLQSASKCLQANCQMAFCNSCCAHMALFWFFTTKFCGFDSHPKLGRIYNFDKKCIRTVDWNPPHFFCELSGTNSKKEKRQAFFQRIFRQA